MVIVPIPLNLACIAMDIVILVLSWRLLLTWWHNTSQLNAVVATFNRFVSSIEALVEKAVRKVIHQPLSPRQRLALVLLLFIGARLLLSEMASRF